MHCIGLRHRFVFRSIGGGIGTQHCLDRDHRSHGSHPLAGVSNIEEVLEKVEWGTLLFFGSLFVLMKALDEMGLMDFFADFTSDIIAMADAGKGREAVAILIILWVSAIVTAFIDNIPFTASMLPVINNLYAESDLGLPLSPMVWALAFGVCFGGNATLIGSSANVVAVGIAEREGVRVSFMQFFWLGMPITLISCTIATVYLLIFSVAFSWHENADY